MTMYVGDVEHPERDDIRLVDVLHALGDPVRLELVRILDEADGSLCCAQIPMSVSKSTGSHHLKVLREAGIVGSERRGLWAYYYVIPGALDELSEWLS